jgi:hypothetical protein
VKVKIRLNNGLQFFSDLHELTCTNIISFHGEYTQWFLLGRAAMQYELSVWRLETVSISIYTGMNDREGFSEMSDTNSVMTLLITRDFTAYMNIFIYKKIIDKLFIIINKKLFQLDFLLEYCTVYLVYIWYRNQQSVTIITTIERFTRIYWAFILFVTFDDMCLPSITYLKMNLRISTWNDHTPVTLKHRAETLLCVHNHKQSSTNM